MRKVNYDAVTNSRASFTFATDEDAKAAEDFLKDVGLRGRIAALLNEACNEVLQRELTPYFVPAPGKIRRPK